MVSHLSSLCPIPPVLWCSFRFEFTFKAQISTGRHTQCTALSGLLLPCLAMCRLMYGAASSPFLALYCPVVALSGLPASLSGGVWVRQSASADILPGAVWMCHGVIWPATAVSGVVLSSWGLIWTSCDAD